MHAFNVDEIDSRRGKDKERETQNEREREKKVDKQREKQIDIKREIYVCIETKDVLETHP